MPVGLSVEHRVADVIVVGRFVAQVGAHAALAKLSMAAGAIVAHEDRTANDGIAVVVACGSARHENRERRC